MSHKQISDETPTRSIIMAGEPFNVFLPYSLGDRLDSEAEVNMANQTRCENLRNNLSDSIKHMIEEAKAAGVEFDRNAAQKLVTEYDQQYFFGLRKPGGRSGDPVESELWDSAMEIVNNAFKAKGMSLKDTKEQREKLAEQLIAGAKGAELRKEAEKRVKARQKAAETFKLDLNELGV
jgi:hypothetical protein